MQYYNRSTNQTVQSLPDYATAKNCRDYGYWPIYSDPFTADQRYFTSSPGPVVYNEASDSYTQTWVDVPLPLELVKVAKDDDFKAAFAEIDAKFPRSGRGIILSLVDGTFPKDTDMQAMTSDQEQRIIDIGIMWELEQVAEENRLLREGIMGTTIPEDATEDEARAIITRVIEMKPWVPWMQVTDSIKSRG